MVIVRIEPAGRRSGRARASGHERRHLAAAVDVGQVQARARRHGQRFGTGHGGQLLARLHQAVEVEFVSVTLASHLAHYVFVVVVPAIKSNAILLTHFP